MARVEGGAVVIDTDWPGLKAQIDNRNVNFKYEEDATAYEIFAIDGQYFYSTIIYKSGQAPQNQATFDTWRTEFETSYKNRITDFNSTQPTYISNVDGYSVVLKDGASPTANDGYGIAVIASDGTNYRMLKSDTSGRPILVGAGVAGTPAGGILSIQGVAGGTVLPISGSVSVTGSVTTTNASVGSNASAIPTSSTQVGGSDGTNLQALRVFDADTGGGTQYVLGVGLRKSASGGSVDFGTSSDPIRIDPTGTTTQPVNGTVTANAGTGTFTVAGTVTANIGTTNGLALDATLTGGTQTTRITDGTNTATVKAASTAAGATDKALVVAVSPNNSVAVTGTFFQATQPVSGTVTANIGTTNGLALDATLAKLTITQGTALGSNTQAMVGGSVTTAAPTYTTGQISPLSLTTAGALRTDSSSTTQPISGTVAATQSGTWTVQPGNTANTTPWLTTISQGGNSATVTGSNALKVDGSAVTQPVSGTVTANAGTGNFTNASIGAINATLPASASVSGFSDGTNTQAARVFDADTGGGTQYVQGVNLRLSASGGSVEFGTNTNPIRIDPTGVTTQPVSGTVAATQSGAWTVAATQSGTWTVQPGNTANTTPWLTTISQGGNSATVTASNALKVDGSAVTQPVSGTVTANIGTTNGLALDATLTGGTQRTKITDGTNNAAVKAASTAAIATDPALVVAISPNNTVAVTQSTSPWVTNVSQIGGSTVTTIAAGEQKVATEGLAANGAAASGNPVLIAGKDDANVARTVRTDPAGDVRVVVGNVPSNATYGNPFGQSISTNPSGKLFALRATAYTEQTTNAQRSIKSSSTLDTNTAGTGARQVVITYLDQTGAGPFTETINLNGTTAVNTVSTTICFIEEIHVISVGSTGSNQGTISLFTTTGGGGSAFASIGVGNVVTNGTVGDNQTIWAHHYTPTGKTSTIVATAFGTNGNQTGNGLMRSQNPTVATSPEVQITGTIVLDASSPTITRTYQVPVPIVGPARTTFYGISSGTNTTFYGVFEYWDI